MNYDQMIGLAQRINKERDAIDRRTGGVAPQDCPIDEQVRTIMSALKAAIGTEDWNAVAEAQVMLSDIHRQIAGKEFNP